MTLPSDDLSARRRFKLQGFAADSGGFDLPARPLVMSMSNVVSDSPSQVSVIASDAQLTLSGVNLPILPSGDARVVVNGTAVEDLDAPPAVDCSRAYVPFPSLTSPDGITW